MWWKQDSNFVYETNMYGGNEIASLFMKHVSTKLHAGTHKFVSEFLSKFVNKFVLYT